MTVLKVIAIILLLLALVFRTPGIFYPKFIKNFARKFYYMNENILKTFAIILMVLIAILTYTLFNNSIIKVEEFVISGFIFMMLVGLVFLSIPNVYNAFLKEFLKVPDYLIRIVAFLITVIFLALIFSILFL